MGKIISLAGRIFQLIGLLAMPSAIVVGEMFRDERQMIAIFAGAFVVFMFGWLIEKVGRV